MAGQLFLVSTPIGNLADISQRAIEVLRSVEIIACEDTRHSRKLLDRIGVSEPKLLSYHEHNEAERAEELIGEMLAASSVAVISDAGTPAINDPGTVLVRRAIEAGVTVVPVPGPVAFVAAAIVSGIAPESIFFGGFLPSRPGERRKRLREVAVIPATLIFYDSPHRIGASLADCLAVLGDRRAAVSRELTKVHEETIRGTLSELAERFAHQEAKGELVLVIERSAGDAPLQDPTTSFSARVSELEAGGTDRRSALKAAAKEFGLTRSEAYRRLVEEGGEHA